MQIYLPIAEVPINMALLLAIGCAVGFLSGLFGVGGGFLMTPLLIFSGISPAVAVASGAAQIVASSISGAIAQWRRRALDLKMGSVLLVGGLIGSSIGILIFRALRAIGQIDLAITLVYVVFLGAIGSLTFYEALRAMARARGAIPASRRSQSHHSWLHGLPLKMRFHRSKLYVSAVPPFGLGVLVGVLGAIMGVGGGFFLVPAMIYLLRMPTSIVIGTSLFPIIFVMAYTAVLHAATNRTVDIVLALFLIAGGVIGAQFGALVGRQMKAEQLRAALGFIILAVALRLSVDLVLPPDDPYTIEVLR